MDSFGGILKRLRTNKGITQEKLANDLDIPESTIRRLEVSNGVPRRERLDQIANYFNVTTDYLLGRSVKEETTTYETQLDSDKKYAIELLNKITDPDKKKAAVEVLKGLAGEK